MLLRIGVFLMAMALFAAACTGTNDPDPGSAPAPTAPAAQTTEGATPTPDLVGTFPEGARVLDVAISEPSTLDPMRIQDPGSVLVARQLYAGLTAWDPEAQEVVPEISEGWGVERGGRRFTFRLAEGMTYHDGSPVMAADFIFAFNRIAQKRSGSELAYTLEHIQGFEEVNGLGTSQRLSGLRAPNERTLVIELEEPFRDLPAVLTHPGLVPLKRRFVEDDAFVRRPIGNGPFEMAESWNPGEEVVLQRFAGFLRTPILDGIRFTPFPDAAASWLQFVDGQFDVAEVPSGQTEAAAEAYGERGFQPFLAGYYLGVNLRAQSLKSLKLRRAVSRAIDRQAIADRIYKGTLVPARGIIPHGMPGFQENVCVPICQFDRTAAERLVQELPRRRRRVTIEFSAGPPHGQVVRAIRSDLESVGLTVRTRSFPLNRYLRRLRAGDQQIYRLGWIAEYPVPDVFLSDLFGSDSPDNHSGFSSARVDRMLERARRTGSGSSRVQRYIEAEKAILRRLPVIPIGSFVTHWVAQQRVQGIRFDSMGGFDAVGISIADDAAQNENESESESENEGD